MLARIKSILDAKKLTPTQFADAIGVARPNVSHILSGRNKPSLEVVQKIIAAFPDIALPWLLSGTGSMMAEEQVAASGPSVPPVAPHAAKRPTLKAPKTGLGAQQGLGLELDTPSNAATQPEASIDLQNFPAVDTAAIGPPILESIGLGQPTQRQPLRAAGNSVAGATAASSTPDSAFAAPMVQALSEPGKTIRRIVIFYQDGTFTDYQPER